jgi:hypothetical protein
MSYLAERNIGVFSTDIDSRDFKLHKPEDVIKSVMSQLEHHHAVTSIAFESAAIFDDELADARMVVAQQGSAFGQSGNGPGGQIRQNRK